MEETIKVRWLEDHEQNKIAPKTLITQVLNENGSRFKDSFDTAIAEMTASMDEGKRQTRDHINNTDVHVTQEEKDTWSNIINGYATEEYVTNLYQKLNSNTILGFYCIEPVTIITNGISKTYPSNSNVEIAFIEDDVFEIVPTSDNSILSLTAFPGTLGTFYPWLEGVAQFSNILFDMNNEAMYSKWSQGNQGSYHVQKAQYVNCIFWSDNPYISDVSKRTNYTLTHTSQLPLCYSTIPDNTFKAFYLAFGVTSDPNWGNQAYRDSFAKATWATQVFSYYGARTIGIVGHDDPDFNIVLPKDCRGLMFDARHIENAGTFDAINVTNFGAKSGSWREAFGFSISLKRLYIKNLKVNLNLSWSPIDYDSISYIISAAANTNKITISVSPYTYNLLSQADFDLAASKNITIALLTGNYVEDRRLGEIANKADKTYVDNEIAGLVNSAPETLNTLGELATAFNENKEVVDALNEAIVLKADKSYVDESLSTKANIEEPRFSGSMGLNHTGELGWTAVSLGFANTASGMYSFAEGMGTKATGDASHAEGTGNTASGSAAHAEGYGTEASDTGAHAEGAYTKATGFGSHAEGSYTIASGEGQHAEGKYNLEDSTAIHIVGNGTAESKRSNAHTLNLNGEAWFAGDVYVSSTSGTNKDEGSKKLATEEYVNIRVPAWTDADEEKVLKIVNGVPTWVNLINYITFTIGGYGEYTAEEGMTWKEWCLSKYNTYYWSPE